MAESEVDWEDILAEIEPDMEENLPQQHQCNECGKRVRTAIGLRRHAKIHQTQQSGTSDTSTLDTNGNQKELKQELPELLKQTAQKMLDSQMYDDVPQFSSVLTKTIARLDSVISTEATKKFFDTVQNGMWSAVTTDGLPNQKRELMWTKFHWFRTNSDTVLTGVQFLAQYCTEGEGILKQVLQSILLQLVAMVTTFLAKFGQQQTDGNETEVLPAMNSDEENVLRYVAGWTVSKLKKKFQHSQSPKFVAFSSTLQGMERRKENEQSFLSKTMDWTEMQNRGGLTFVSDNCFLLFRHIHRVGTAQLNAEKLSTYKGGNITYGLEKKLETHTLVNKYWLELTQNICQQWREELFSSLIKLYITLNGHNMVEIYKQKKQSKANSLLKEQRALRKALKASSNSASNQSK